MDRYETIQMLAGVVTTLKRPSGIQEVREYLPPCMALYLELLSMFKEASQNSGLPMPEDMTKAHLDEMFGINPAEH